VGGLTLVLAPVTTPTPWSMETLVAPVTLQDRVELWPAWIDAGVAKNDAMTGTDPAGVTVTIAVWVAEPAALVAVSV
jgi:hypothetical protein